MNFFRRQQKTGLTKCEKIVLRHLVDAWNEYLMLPNSSPAEQIEFQTGIHTLQHIIALRVARRTDPDCWAESDYTATDRPPGLEIEEIVEE